MRVLELTLKWENGGVERYVGDLVHSARVAGFDCSVASVTSAVNSFGVLGYGPLLCKASDILWKAARIRDYISDNRFDIVHIHGNNGLAFKMAHEARRGGAKATIVHSHNSGFGRRGRLAKQMYTDYARSRYQDACSRLFACSELAGKHLFHNAPFIVAKNGVDISRFHFQSSSRSLIRKKMGIREDSHVIGFAASLIDVKNPLFALEVFRELLAVDSNAVFMVCGDGNLLGVFKRLANDLIVNKQCVLAGRVSEIEKYYCSMDVLVAPSCYEGLPINLVEAQASALPILMSDAISPEVALVPDLCRQKSLGDSPRSWAMSLLELGRTASTNREAAADAAVSEVVRAGYSQPDCFQPIFECYREVA